MTRSARLRFAHLLRRRSWLGVSVGVFAAVLAFRARTAEPNDTIVWPQSDESAYSLTPANEAANRATPPLRAQFADWGSPVLPRVALQAAGGSAAYEGVPQSYLQAEPSPFALQPAGNGNGSNGNGNGGNASEEKLGKAPEDNRELFLRQATVLLQPGQAQFDWGFDYTWQEATIPVVLSDGSVANERFRDRRIVSPFALRYGVTKRLQAFVNMPVGFGLMESADAEHEVNDTVFNLGDISTGVNYLLRKGEGVCPDIVGTFGVTAPTGPFQFASGLLNQAALGTGFWAINTDLLFVKSIDPVVVFYGIGYRHYFQRDFFGGLVTPGEELNYNFGVGFAINDSLTLSTIFLGAFRGDTQFNSVNLPGSSQEPLSVRFALTAVASKCYIVEPSVRIGLTPDAANADFGITMTRTF
jgi:hypothetical protein